MFARGQAARIEEYLRASLAAAETECDRNAVISVLNELMVYCGNASRYAEALEASERALAEMRDQGYADTVHYGTTLLNSATVQHACGNEAEACAQFREALSIYEANLPEDDYRLAGVYNNASVIYGRAGLYAAALQALQRALNIMERHDAMKEQSAIVQTNLAMVLFKMNHEPEAISELENALELFRSGPDKSGERVKPGRYYAAALAGVAEAYFRMRRFDEAVRVYEDAMKHLSAVFGKNRDYAVLCGNCALACESLGDVKRADTYRIVADTIVRELDISEGLLE